MAVNFHLDIVGKPFSKSVIKELNRRTSLRQLPIDGSSTEIGYIGLTQPYVKLKRIKNLPKWNNSNPNNQEINYETGKYSELGYVNNDAYKTNEGLKDVINKNGEYKLSPFIDTITIEQTDFTFFTINVNFTIPDITDFKQFKMMWFDFGLPVEVEWGRKTGIRVNNVVDENNNLINTDPAVQKMTGVIASFDYKSTMNRMIKGNIKIISTNLLFVLNKLNNDYENKLFDLNIFKDHIKRFLYMDNSIYNNDKYIYYTYQDEKEFVKTKIVFNPIEFINTYNPTVHFEKQSIIDTINKFGGEKVEFSEFKLEQTDYIEFYKDVEKLVNSINKLILDPFMTLEEYENYKKNIGYYYDIVYKKHLRDKKNRIKDILNADYYSNTQYEEILDYINEDVQEKIIKLNNNNDISKLYKYLISLLRLDSQKYFTDRYYYLSLDAIEWIINRILSKTYGEVDESKFFRENNDNPIINKLQKVELRFAPYNQLLSLGSIYPSKVIFNPRNKRYIVDKYDRTKYVEAEDGIFSLSKDIFISAKELFELFETKDSIYDILVSIIDLINYCSNGLVKFTLTNKPELSNDGRIASHIITIKDDYFIAPEVQNENYWVLDLFNPKYYLKSLEVLTDIPSDIGSTVYLKEMSKYLTDGNTNQKTNDSTKETDIHRSNLFKLWLVDTLEDFSKSLDAISVNIFKDLENVYNSSDFNESQKISVSGLFGYINVYYRTLMEIFKLKSVNIVNNNRLVEIPLKISFSIDGINGIIPSQMFKVTNKSFPIGYDMIGQESEWTSFVVTNLSHSITNGKWDTNIQAQLYLSSRASSSLKLNNEKAIKAINEYKNELEELKKIAIDVINNALKSAKK